MRRVPRRATHLALGVLAVAAAGAGPGQAESAAPTEADRLAAAAPAHPAETEAALPEGPGRDETFGYCVACHSTAVIRRSGLSRARWDELMDWMSERHGMAPLEGELRQTIVDYLARHFGPRGGRGGGQRGGNPFASD